MAGAEVVLDLGRPLFWGDGGESSMRTLMGSPNGHRSVCRTGLTMNWST